jgi:hypothetical protein
MIFRDRRWDQFDGVVVLRGTFENLGVKDRNPDKNCDHHDLHAIAEKELRPRRLPLRER